MMLMLAAEPPDEQEGLRRGCASVTRRANAERRRRPRTV